MSDLYARKTRKTWLKEAEGSEGIVLALVGATEWTDADGDRVVAGAFEDSLRRRPHPVGLAAHNWEHRVAKTIKARELRPGDPEIPEALREEGMGAVEVLGQYNLAEDDVIARQEFARVVFFGPDQEWSMGFFVEHWRPTNNGALAIIDRVDWVEWSSVVAGAAPGTRTVIARSARPATAALVEVAEKMELPKACADALERWISLLDLRVAQRLDEVERAVRATAYGPELRGLLDVLSRLVVYSAIPPHSTPVVDEEWDGPEMVARVRAEREQLRALHAWVDAEADPDTKAAYKLPHHQVSQDGSVGAANIRGVRAALAALAGARGGVDIPRDDVPGVREHLERHVRDFESEERRRALLHKIRRTIEEG